MHDLDVLMLTNTVNDSLYKMVSKAVDTLRKSDGLEDVNIILLESNQESNYTFDVNHYIKPDFKFNYNAYLNIGSEFATGKYTCISNNDIEFSKTWWTKMKAAFEKYNLDVASPKSTMRLQPHNNQNDYLRHMYAPESVVKIELKTYSFAGWCFTFTQEVRDWLFPLDENFSHYHQDLDIMMRLHEKNVTHGFVPASKMLHFGNVSSNLLHDGKIENMRTTRMYFDKKWAGHDMSFMELNK